MNSNGKTIDVPTQEMPMTPISTDEKSKAAWYEYLELVNKQLAAHDPKEIFRIRWKNIK